ncbi:hypothetical protein [Deinococcus sp.]|uniref:hypothetical protein n=1 Tax=Deinococcus sp. TaxID=47478 RepID=UPI0025CF7A26|nr:hypothetical protein [Deinococcus sp.]
MTGSSDNLSDCQRCELELGAVLLGIADARAVRFVKAHLPGCPECSQVALDLQATMTDLLYVEPVEMAPSARNALLERARQVPLEAEQIKLPVDIQPLPDQVLNSVGRPSRARPSRWGAWIATGLGLAAALGLFVPRLSAGPDIRQADVVISAGDSLVLARSENSRYPLVIRTASGQLRGVELAQARPAWYTEGVYSGGKAYLLDAANERLVVLNVNQGKVERTYPAPGGAAGLAVNDQGIFVKSAASGEMRLFRGESCVVTAIGQPATIPQADYMDAVLAQPNRILTTQHVSGQVVALSVDGSRVLARYQVGGAPVGLASWQGRTLVLDVQGRLLELNASGQITRTLAVPGHPDKFSLMGDHAYLTDRGGRVSEIDLVGLTVTRQRTFGKPMDIVALPDGRLALADATRGLVMLRSDLSEL